MNDLLKTTMGLVAAGAVLPFGSLCAQKVAQQPNVLMLVVDDWGAHDLSLNRFETTMKRTILTGLRNNLPFFTRLCCISAQCTFTLFVNYGAPLCPSAGRSKKR